MTDRASTVKIADGFDVAELVQDLEAVDPNLWAPIITHRKLEWHGVALRSADGHPSTMRYAPACKDTVLMQTLPAIRRVVMSVESPLLRVRLLGLQPGAVIGTHSDEPSGTLREARLHLPITTNAHASFTIDGVKVTMLPGELWWMDVSRPHSARNDGSEPRVHLVIDCVHDAWLDAQLAR